MSLPALVTTTHFVPVIVFSVLATVAVGLRIYGLQLQRSSLRRHADLWLVVVALAICWGDTIQIICCAAIQGLDTTHQNARAYAQFNYNVKLGNIILNSLSSAFVKLSILQFYENIFGARVWYFSWSVRLMQVLVSIWGLAGAIVALLTLDANVKYSAAEFTLGISGSGMVLDLLTLCLPIPLIVQLHMSARKKWKVVGIIWLGIFCVVCAILRFYYIYVPADPPTPAEHWRLFQEGDFWARMEPLASIIVACLPTYAPLVNSRPLKQIIRSVHSLRSLRSWDRKSSHGSSAAQTIIGSPDLAYKSRTNHSFSAPSIDLQPARTMPDRVPAQNGMRPNHMEDQSGLKISVQRDLYQVRES